MDDTWDPFETHPVRLSVAYPDRDLDRSSTFFRPLLAIPILILLGSVLGSNGGSDDAGPDILLGFGGFLSVGPLLMIVFRKKYPRWWFDWNVELLRFANRVAVYVALMDDRYPATDHPQSVRLDIPYPDATRELDRLMPLVKWILAIPHFVLLFFLSIGAVCAVVVAWFSILFTRRYPRGLFDYVEGVLRWQNRVIAYAVILTTDRYPPFGLN